MLGKELASDKVSDEYKPAFLKAIAKEWKSSLDYESCDILTREETRNVEAERPDRVLPSRFVLRNKNAGLVGPDGQGFLLKGKARLSLAGHMCPDSLSGELQLDFLPLSVYLPWCSCITWCATGG